MQFTLHIEANFYLLIYFTEKLKKNSKHEFVDAQMCICKFSLNKYCRFKFCKNKISTL